MTVKDQSSDISFIPKIMALGVSHARSDWMKSNLGD